MKEKIGNKLSIENLGDKMFHWRITKYNPKMRNRDGSFSGNEWTSYSDIGKKYHNQEFTYQQYMEIENKYIQSILLFMNCLGINSLRLSKLEKNNSPNFGDLNIHKFFDSLKEGNILNKDEIVKVARMVLREIMWCKLESRNMYVHFGYDYYMYLGTTEVCEEAIKKIEDFGLFIEPFKSPYLE